jgi:hypothetical protein
VAGSSATVTGRSDVVAGMSAEVASRSTVPAGGIERSGK